MSLYGELKRRNVLRVATAYVAVSWLLIQVLDTLLPIFDANESIARITVIILAIGFLPVLILSWVFELTPDGLKRDGDVDQSSASSRDSAKSLDRLIIGVLAVAVVYFAVDKFILDPERDKEVVAEATQQARDAALVRSYGEHSIAVMPFSDLSPNQDQEYFSDGIAEEIINLLSRIQNLRVIARSSAFSFKGQNLAASEIAERLNVRYVMEGSVRRAGDRLRITTTIIDARTDTQLWSEKFDRNFDDIFAIQDEIAGETVNRIEMQVSGAMPLTNRVDPESYSLFLQARHAMSKHSDPGSQDALRFLEQALEIDPANVEALTLLSGVYRSREYFGHMSLEEAIAKSKDVIDKALELNPSDPYALMIKRSLQRDAIDTWKGEIEAASYNLTLLPTDVQANLTAAGVLGTLGLHDKSLAYADYVLSKDPLCGGCLRAQMLTLMAKGDLAAADESAQRYVAISGGAGTYNFGLIKFFQGDFDAALELIESSRVVPFVKLQGRALVYWRRGDTELYDETLAELEAALENPEYDKFRIRPADFLAGLYSYVGRHDEAFAILDELIDPPRSWGPIRWNADPLFRPLHDDPRWVELLEREGSSAEQLASYELDKLFPGPGKKPIQ